jgi:hypothetical protein
MSRFDEIEKQVLNLDGSPTKRTVMVEVMPVAHVYSMTREIEFQLDLFVQGVGESGTEDLRKAIKALLKASDWKGEQG